VLSKAFGLRKEKSATAEEKVEDNFVTLSKDLLSLELRMRLLWRNVYICLKLNNLHNYSYSVEKPKGSFWRGRREDITLYLKKVEFDAVYYG
jgi:hypothetical protein